MIEKQSSERGNPRVPEPSTERVLLVEPAFPIPAKSKNHKDFLPIGLLKISSYLQSKQKSVELMRGIPETEEEREEVLAFNPQEIWVTSLFTYWAKYVRIAVLAYKELLPKATVVVGGVYASLFNRDEVAEYTGCDLVYQGVFDDAECFAPDYDCIKDKNPHPVDYQILHSSRGCKRRCRFCGTWKIEPTFVARNSIADQVTRRKLVFYDNNFLANPNVEDVLDELISLKKDRQILWCEAQSGFDGRILLKTPHLAQKIRDAGFRYPRIAWDWGYDQKNSIKKQIDLLLGAGYPSKSIFVFVLYNWDIPYDEMELKRIACLEWEVQISDCRYRPLDQTEDEYNPRRWGQTPDEYHIHMSSGWTDAHVKQFRRNVRQQNICVRHGFPFYSNKLERKDLSKNLMKKLRKLPSLEEKTRFMDDHAIPYWIPGRVRYPQQAMRIRGTTPKSKSSSLASLKSIVHRIPNAEERFEPRRYDTPTTTAIC